MLITYRELLNRAMGTRVKVKTVVEKMMQPVSEQ